MANTFILFWNPDITSFSAGRFRALRHWWKDTMNWSVWAHDLAHDGDRFFLVKCGTRPNGIVMSGRFCSEPYKGMDWSGKGRDVFYMDLDMEFIGDPQDCILSSDILAKNIPNFDWYGGHSGRLLNEEDAMRLELLWQAFINKYVIDWYVGDNDDEDDCEEFEEDEEVDEDDDDASEALDEDDENEVDNEEVETDEDDNEDVYDEDEVEEDEAAADEDDNEDVHDAEADDDAEADKEDEDDEDDEDEDDEDDVDIERSAVCSRKRYSLWLQEEWRERVDEYLRKKHGEACEICGFDYSVIFEEEANKSNAYKYLGTGECEDLETVESEYHCLCNNCNQIVSDIDDFEKYQSLAKEYAQKSQFMNMFMDNFKSLQAFISGAKTSKLNQKVDHLLEKVADKSDVLMHGYEKYRSFMDFLKNNKKNS